jgi:pimeloyl-ACP methyl ester carboxylesterase
VPGSRPVNRQELIVDRYEHDGASLAYERAGQGPPLLFLVGSGSTVASMQVLVEVLAGSFDVAANDPRGMGESDTPPGPWTMAECAADALALADHLDWRRFRLFGISFGGMLAQELAVTWPERVERMVLACTSPGGEGGSSYPLQDLAALPPEERRRTGLLLLDARFTPEWLAEHPKDAGLADLVAQRAGGEDAEHARGAAEQLAARAGHDVCDRLHRITCPTLVAGGRYDGIAPPANGDYIAAHVPGAERRLYEGGHAFFAQDPVALPEIVAFLAG